MRKEVCVVCGGARSVEGGRIHEVKLCARTIVRIEEVRGVEGWKLSIAFYKDVRQNSIKNYDIDIDNYHIGAIPYITVIN